MSFLLRDCACWLTACCRVRRVGRPAAACPPATPPPVARRVRRGERDAHSAGWCAGAPADARPAPVERVPASAPDSAEKRPAADFLHLQRTRPRRTRDNQTKARRGDDEGMRARMVHESAGGLPPGAWTLALIEGALGPSRSTCGAIGWPAHLRPHACSFPRVASCLHALAVAASRFIASAASPPLAPSPLSSSSPSCSHVWSLGWLRA